MTEPSSRHIPTPLRRQIMVEAGHRCSIPACRATPALEVHHIESWAKVKEHAFDNLICLCAVCHQRATTGEIDRLAMLQYKANLTVISNRYGDFERRVLEVFTVAEEEPSPDLILSLQGGRDLDLLYLMRDGLLRKLSHKEMLRHSGGGMVIAGTPAKEGYHLTGLGTEFVMNLRLARPVE